MSNVFVSFRRCKCHTPARLFIVTVVLWSAVLQGCSRSDAVKEYFQAHGMEYPADASGVGMTGIQYIGIARDELEPLDARDFIEQGIMYAKVYLKRKGVQTLMPGVEAIVVEKPVFFRDEAGGVGLMVTVHGFGTATPAKEKGLEIEWIGRDRDLWKVENFAYFNRNDFYKWQFGGWVY